MYSAILGRSVITVFGPEEADFAHHNYYSQVFGRYGVSELTVTIHIRGCYMRI
jgi:hypothetical protein